MQSVSTPARKARTSTVTDNGAHKPRAADRLEPVDAFRLARKKFIEGTPIDMQSLAAELGVSRVTLYRWVGNRDKLLTEIIWNLGSRTIAMLVEREQARQRRGTAASKDGRTVARILSRFTAEVIAHHGMREFVRRDGEYALRLLTRADGDFQPRLVAAVRGLLTEEMRSSGWKPPIALNELARTLVHLIEFHVHREVITGERPKPKNAEVVLQLLLR
jgi:AcrR family transcriptional regulator